MTVSTTINSLLLTFGPIFVTYYGYNLKQYNSYGACLFGALAFILTQVAKFILLAVVFPMVFPSSEFDEADQTTGGAAAFVFEHDVLKAIVSCIDIVGLYFLFNAKKLVNVLGDIEVKILAIGLGWAGAELLTSHFLDIIFQSWSNEMKMEYLIQAASANFDLMEIIALAYCAHALTKKDENGSSKRFLIYLLILARYLLPVVSRFALENVREADGKQVFCEKCVLGAKAVFAFVFYAIAKNL